MLIIKQHDIIECLKEIKSKQPLLWYNESIHDLFGKISALYLELSFSFDDSNKMYNILSNIIYVSTQTIKETNLITYEQILIRTLNNTIQHGDKSFSTIHEMFGVLTEEYYELVNEVHNNNIDNIKEELLDVCAVSLFGICSFNLH